MIESEGRTKNKKRAQTTQKGASLLSLFGLYEEKTRPVNDFGVDGAGVEAISETLLK